MTPHSFTNVVIEFAAGRCGAVDAVIRAFAQPGDGNHPTPAIHGELQQVRGLHYMSITVARPECPSEAGSGLPPDPAEPAHLLIEMSSDTGSEEALTDLVARFGAELRQLLAAAGFALQPAELPGFLIARLRKIGASWSSRALGQTHCGSPGQSVERIQRECALVGRIEQMIAPLVATPAWRAMSPRERVERIRAMLWVDPADWKWAFVPEPAPCLGPAPLDVLSVFNPQIWKALAYILNTLAWPLYIPFVLLVLGAFIWGWIDGGFPVAKMWSSYVAVALVAAGALAAFAAFLRLRSLERTDAVEEQAPTKQHGADLLAMENFGGQNHLASVSRVKPGLLRRLTLRLAFVVVGAGPYVDAPGFLGKNGVIHFARWMHLPKTNQLLFWSNYDDSWESYVADFIADAPTGVTAIWSNCFGFPRSRSLFGGGAADRDRLVRWARRQQHPTYFWYSAYRDLTTARIRINAAIRQGIASAESQQDCADWLALFGSAPRPVYALQTPEIPTLVFGGMSTLRFGTSLAVTLKDQDPLACKALLHWLRPLVVFGENPYDRAIAVVLGISARGLQRLGLRDDSLETFPVAFKQGMWVPDRARQLGDVGDNAPANWDWGGAGTDADLFLLLYGLDDATVKAKALEIRAVAASLGSKVTFEQPLTELQDKYSPACGLPPKEPFGFTDGVSQPIIRGSPRSNRARSPNDVVEAGEFVFGYPDNIGMIPPPPTIPDDYDPSHLLADAGPDALRKRPESGSYEGSGSRDLGMNGTFLVVRHLRQEVGRFQNWLHHDAIPQLLANGSFESEPIAIPIKKSPRPPVHITLRGGMLAQAEPHAIPGREELDSIIAGAGVVPVPIAIAQITLDEIKAVIRTIEDLIVSKLVGRWTDGASLVRHSHPPGSVPHEDREPDNEFVYQEDPCGNRCPFGAHIRRANPRDTRFPGSAEEIAATNRHRLLRVGRVYGQLLPGPDCNKLDPAVEQGLMFMCLNTDIERQFEFVQKTWLLNPSIHGLRDEVDPLLGTGTHAFTVPSPYGPINLPPLPQLVTLRGGGYFFVPGRTTLRFLAAP